MEDYENIKQPSIGIKDFRMLVNQEPQQCRKTDSEALGKFPKGKTFEEKSMYLAKLSRSAEWMAAASRQLLSTIQSLNRLIGNEKHAIRAELATVTCTLIERCSNNMAPCMASVFELTIALSQDSSSDIAQKCMQTIQRTLHDDHKIGIEAVEQIFRALLVRMPRIIYTGQDDEKIACVQLLKETLQILSTTPSKLTMLLSSAETLDQFTVVLIAAVEMTRSIELLQDEHSIRTVTSTEYVRNKRPWKQFKHCAQPKLQEILAAIGQCLGQSRACKIIVNYLLDLFDKAESSCNEVIVLLQFILPVSVDKTYMSAFLAEFLSDQHWRIAVQSNQVLDKDDILNDSESIWYEDHTKGLYESAVSIRYTDVRYMENDRYGNKVITINDAKFNVLHICLLLETIGVYATALKEEFQPFVMQTLYRILDKTGKNTFCKFKKIIAPDLKLNADLLSGSSNYVIHAAGLFALDNVCEALEYGSISDLIHYNSDYIAHYVNLSLKRVSKSIFAIVNYLNNFTFKLLF